MKRKLATIYAIFCTLLLAAGFLLTFSFAWAKGVWDSAKCLLGFALGFVLAPVVHELGHVYFAWRAKMECVFVKCFCFKMYTKNGKKKFAFASPFAPDETQVFPLSGGNMRRRASFYALGGLLFGGVFLLCLLIAATTVTLVTAPCYLLWGLIPYPCYLFLLNAAPFTYASGKTDALVYVGLQKGCDAEKTLLAAMEIQGRLFEGKSFSEIEEKWYFDLPQLCEDEPLFSVMLDLRYRYYLEKGDMEKAGDCLNRLIDASAYIPDAEFEKIAAELVYMNALCGELDVAEQNAKSCWEFLQGETVTAKRVLAAWAQEKGEREFVETLLTQAETALPEERVVGVRNFEKILLNRMKTGKNG